MRNSEGLAGVKPTSQTKQLGPISICAIIQAGSVEACLRGSDQSLSLIGDLLKATSEFDVHHHQQQISQIGILNFRA